MIMVLPMSRRNLISVRYMCIVRRIPDDMKNVKTSVPRFVLLAILFFFVLGKNSHSLYVRYMCIKSL